MLDATFQVVQLPAAVAEAGHAYGRLLRDHLTWRLEPYLAEMRRINRVEPESLAAQAAAWARRLPEQYQIQMDAMAAGAGVDAPTVWRFLYADIASSTSGWPARAESSPVAQLELGEGEGGGGGGPMCSGMIVPTAGGPWVGRNCDWYQATLQRGTAAVVHRVPHRIPCMALGLMGDIDADTGVNAERLWLHVHTLLARDEPRSGVSVISWLFWLREALETCATLADLERLLASTDRDRGVMLFAADGKSGECAIYECAKSGFRRIDPDPSLDAGRLFATNHCRHKHPQADVPRVSRPGSTVTRYNRLRELLSDAPPEDLPHDLIEILADPMVEMREATYLRTIYSAAVNPASGEVWFASGAAPAASAGRWRRVPWAW